MVLPVNYVIASSTVVLRTGTGSLIAAHGDDQVAFEADHLDEAQGQGWSVLVRGRAHRVLQPGELRNLKHECEPRPWPAGEHGLYIRIVPEHITGRRIRTQ
jgi:nitroimidazol reductase NimA-like FMN-containing flavoprotein (pyridoxamine 5'-phosphate oxidase superfamily)